VIDAAVWQQIATVEGLVMMQSRSETWTDPGTRPRRAIVVGICVALTLITCAVFLPTVRYSFLNYDDNTYVYDNPHITGGVTWSGVRWALTHAHSENWHPLTSLSHMLDCQIWDVRPAGHHLTNVLLHTVAVLLCFLVLSRMTGSIRRSAAVAALFAIHPLRVESVAWVSERKDVLSGVFFMLTLAAYLRYTRRRSVLNYALVVLCFAAGLLSKPTLVTLPFVLLLLDYWPLRRFEADRSARTAFRLFVEKLPLLALSLGSAVATIVAQDQALLSIDRMPLTVRLANALLSYGVYLKQMFWPANLAVFYPLAPPSLHFGKIVAAALLLVVCTAGAVALARRRPYIAVGWFWYLGVLIPMIGIIQVGAQSHADRYSYLSQIGLYIALVGAIADVRLPSRWRRRALSTAAISIILALAFVARSQARVWRDSESLWRHALDVTGPNATALDHYGSALAKQGRIDEAIPLLEQALRFAPRSADSHNNLAIALAQKGRIEEAIEHYKQALGDKSQADVVHYNLGNALTRKRDLVGAAAEYRAALRERPDYVQAFNNLGGVLLELGQIDEAIEQYQSALRIAPAFVEADKNLHAAVARKENTTSVSGEYRTALERELARNEEAVKREPGNVDAQNRLGLALYQANRREEAIAVWQKVLAIDAGNLEARNNLAVAYLQSGRPAEAAAQWQKSIDLHPANAEARISLAWVYATCAAPSLRDGAKAVSLVQEAEKLTPRTAVTARTLAAALAECGRFDVAQTAAEEALKLAEDQKDQALAEKLRRELELYRAGRPVRENSIAP
jgi:tetratricopeptide (TPR) repeat protein